MTALRPVPDDPPPEDTESRLQDVIAVVDRALLAKAGWSDPESVAAAEAEQHEASRARERARRAGWQAAVARQPMLAVAVHLARAVAIGDRAGAEVLLSRQRSLPELRELAEILASAADPSRIGAAEVAAPAAAGGHRALREAS
jgi:hypothetical protein